MVEGQVRDSKGVPVPTFTQGRSFLTVAAEGTSAQSSAIDDQFGVVLRLTCDVNCFYLIGSSPTAKNDGSDGARLAADAIEYRAAYPQDKVACIKESGASDGTLYIEVMGG